MGVIELTTGRVPVSADLQGACCVPLTAVVQPLLPSDSTAPPTILTEEIARCSGCGAYINHLCSFEQYGWACSLCGLQNDYAHIANRRYLGGDEARSTLPELAAATVESLNPIHDVEEHHHHDESEDVLMTPATPIVIALVDVASCPDHIELIRSSLLAAIEALPHDAKFGLIAFGGDEIALYEPALGSSSNAAGPCIRHVPLSPFAPSPTLVEISEVLPLNNLLAPVDAQGKKAIIACIEALEPMGPGKRPLGEALQSVLRLLGSSGATLAENEEDPLQKPSAGILGARLVVALSGPPNYGRGSVLSSSATSASNGATSGADQVYDNNHGAPFLMDPFFPELTAWQSQPPPPEPLQRNRVHADGWAEAVETSKQLNLTKAASELGISGGSPNDVFIRYDAAQFYTEAGAAAASLGIIVDLYAVSDSFVGLEQLKPLVLGSGGILALYPPPNEEECTLTQDLYKRIDEPFAFNCMLRMRACTELKVVGALGTRLRQDPRYADLFHLACCHPYDAFGLELEYTTRSGFASKATPVLQLVMQYFYMVPPQKETVKNWGQTMLQKRTRIVTVAFPVANTALEVYNDINSAAYTFAMVQHLNQVAAKSGVASARGALMEGIVELAAAFHEWVTIGEVVPDPGARRREGNLVPVDPAFKACEALQGLPRAAFALLRSPLFSDKSDHPDSPCALRVLWEILPPSELATAVYPHLSSWASPDQLAFPRHSLCRAALALSRQPIYLLDAYETLVVFYAAQGHVAAGNAPPPFPPPHDSRLRQHCAALRQARRVTPHILVLKEGEQGADRIFGQYLIEDERVQGDAVASGTFLDFLAQVKAIVTDMLEKGF